MQAASPCARANPATQVTQTRRHAVTQTRRHADTKPLQAYVLQTQVHAYTRGIHAPCMMLMHAYDIPVRKPAAHACIHAYMSQTPTCIHVANAYMHTCCTRLHAYTHRRSCGVRRWPFGRIAPHVRICIAAYALEQYLICMDVRAR